MRVGIAVDKWKVSIFKRHLTNAGYAYTLLPSPVTDAEIFYVTTHNVEALGFTVKAAQREAALSRGGVTA